MKKNNISEKREERKKNFIEYFLDEKYTGESERGAKAIVYLIDTVDKNSEVTNKLTGRIKTLTWILVILGVGLLGLEIYRTFFI